ncbi:unnamed protein product, partial [Meganyctiphanes norvegica]
MEDTKSLPCGPSMKKKKPNELPECIEHQLEVRCSKHKAWVCQRCLTGDHASQSCKIITVTEELEIRKSKKLKESKSILNVFEEACKKADDSKEQCKQLIKEYGEDIAKYEAMVKRLKDEIEKKQTSKIQMEEKFTIFDQKLDNLKSERLVYDNAVTSLKSSNTIIKVSQCSDEVQKEVGKLQLISHEIKRKLT